MTKTELRRFQAVLNASIIELERLIRERDGIRVERSADQLEEIQQAAERAIAVCNLDREFNQLRNARAAVLRIQKGTFGTCQQCDEEIHPRRLVAVPWALLCIRCQEAFDRSLEGIQKPSPEFLPTKPLEHLAGATV
jgi:DnaK suppressor protein